MVENILAATMGNDKDRMFRIGALALLFFSGGGLDVASLVGFKGSTSLTFLLIIMLYLGKRIRFTKNELLIPFMAYGLLWFVYVMKGASVPIWCIGPVFGGFFTLTIYKKSPEKFLPDLSKLCKYYTIYTLVGVVLQLLVTGLICPTHFYRYKHILYLFWYVSGDNLTGFRFTGLGGEPGIWQMFLSFNLLFAFYEKRSFTQIVLSVLAIVGTFSTTGYFNMIFVVTFYYTVIEHRIKIMHLAFVAVLGVILFGVVSQGITAKLSNSSGLTRVSDIYIGWMYLCRNPLWGIDPEITNFSDDPEFIALKYEVWGDTNNGAIDPGYVDSGLLSGIMIFLLDYGLLVGSYFVWKLFNFPLITNRSLRVGVVILILLTFMTEPQSRTGWFYFFILAAFMNFKWKDIKKETNNGNINHHCNMECCPYITDMS